MAEKATVRIHQSDKERLNEIAQATGQPVADVIAEIIREPSYVCPECQDPFHPEEVDPETVEEHGVLSTGVDKLVKGQRDVKSFECPGCSERIRPKDIRAVEGDENIQVSRNEMGVTSEKSDGQDVVEPE